MCSDVAIRVEGLSKRYRVPHRAREGGRLRAHLAEFLPFLGGDSEDTAFWALKDVSFEVKRGEVLGILGRNGSGKSTLLKILSRVTFPTRGRAELHGRVGSLLEVGTGFHPDLSGRENVFMSGALLGVPQREIRARFDEIVDFSGIEEFIDMPVKRYSSGMYVRLAYAVASLLDSDILILDEVLAVGDAAFREKSSRNMERVAREGRTILFVSHNERAVSEICNRAIVLGDGCVVHEAEATEAVRWYRQRLLGYEVGEESGQEQELATEMDLTACPRLGSQEGPRRLRSVSMHRADGSMTAYFRPGETLCLRISYDAAGLDSPYLGVLIHNEFAERVASVYSSHDATAGVAHHQQLECRVPDLRLGHGTYRVMLDLGTGAGSRSTMRSTECIASTLAFEVDASEWQAGVVIDSLEGALHRCRWHPVMPAAHGD